MIAITLIFLPSLLLLSYYAIKAGMRQIGILLALCSIVSYIGIHFTDSPLLAAPLAAIMLLGSYINFQLRKYRLAPFTRGH